mgnify:CR=1 FL=1
MISEDKETKICKKCRRKLPLEKFGINHNYTRSMCKECFNEIMRKSVINRGCQMGWKHITRTSL